MKPRLKLQPRCPSLLVNFPGQFFAWLMSSTTSIRWAKVHFSKCFGTDGPTSFFHRFAMSLTRVFPPSARYLRDQQVYAIKRSKNAFRGRNDRYGGHRNPAPLEIALGIHEWRVPCAVLVLG